MITINTLESSIADPVSQKQVSLVVASQQGVEMTPSRNDPKAYAGLPEVLPTNQAATAINRAPQTLRRWACKEDGPIRPIRINGRLAWRVSDLKAILAGGEK